MVDYFFYYAPYALAPVYLAAVYVPFITLYEAVALEVGNAVKEGRTKTVDANFLTSVNKAGANISCGVPKQQYE
jgi:hypothetical protein